MEELGGEGRAGGGGDGAGVGAAGPARSACRTAARTSWLTRAGGRGSPHRLARLWWRPRSSMSWTCRRRCRGEVGGGGGGTEPNVAAVPQDLRGVQRSVFEVPGGAVGQSGLAGVAPASWNLPCPPLIAPSHQRWLWACRSGHELAGEPGNDVVVELERPGPRHPRAPRLLLLVTRRGHRQCGRLGRTDPQGGLSIATLQPGPRDRVHQRACRHDQQQGRAERAEQDRALTRTYPPWRPWPCGGRSGVRRGAGAGGAVGGGGGRPGGELRAAVRELVQYGVLLNQLVAQVNATGDPAGLAGGLRIEVDRCAARSAAVAVLAAELVDDVP